MKSTDFLKEGFVEDAHDVHKDHEVQMARKDCYHAAENAIRLHKLLREIDEHQGLEGWVSAKITLAADYLNTVREYLEYDAMSNRDINLGDELGMSGKESPVMSLAEGRVKELESDLDDLDAEEFKDKYGQTKAEARKKFKKKDKKKEKVQKEGMYQDKVAKSKIPAFQRKNSAATSDNSWMTTTQDLDDEASKSPTGAAGLEKAKKRLRDQGLIEEDTTAANIGSVVNPKSKKSKKAVGELFGGSYKSSVIKR